MADYDPPLLFPSILMKSSAGAHPRESAECIFTKEISWIRGRKKFRKEIGLKAGKSVNRMTVYFIIQTVVF